MGATLQNPPESPENRTPPGGSSGVTSENTWRERWSTEKRWREHYQGRAAKAETFALAAVHFIDYLRQSPEGRDLLALRPDFLLAAKAYFPDLEVEV
jgi:hypothetical protein